MRWWLLASTLIPVVVFSIGCMMPACGCGGGETAVELDEGELAPVEQPGDETGDTGTVAETGDTGEA